MWQQLFLYVCLGLVCAFATCCWDINWFSAQVHPSEKHGFSCGDPVSNNWHPVIWLLKPDGGEIKNKIWTCPIETINFLPKTLQANQQQFTDLIFWKNLGLRQVIGSLMVSSAIEGFRSLGGPGKKQNYKNTLKFATYLLLLFWRKKYCSNKVSTALEPLCNHAMPRRVQYSWYHKSKCWQRRLKSPSAKSSHTKDAGWEPSVTPSSDLNDWM